MTALFGVLVWLPLIVAHPAVLSNWSEFGENNLIAAAAWLLADRHRPALRVTGPQTAAPRN
jgi:hypothetical protein